ncbi:NAD(P)/FAD-dependent oxidoreductase [Subtercola sp. YIM 133946]|uniref:NAD(P)/FAD-dependent oxidoreductase n=1 Tax=Subtercola sp. YIM 133946 TaxID=3118909 RepID=UPI002F92A334
MSGQSYWAESAPAGHPRASAAGTIDADVCIVGAGLTGLWTAYYLARADPALSIVVLEKETVGFGASGRNGGWCSALFPRSAASLERTYGFRRAVAMRQAMVDTVAEMGAVTAAEGISCDFVQGGTLVYAMNAVQEQAARADVLEAARFGVDLVEYREFGARAGGAGDPVAAAGHPAGARGATFDPACARLHPLKLVRGLADVVEGLGVTIYEHTEVTGWSSGRVEFVGGDEGGVRAKQIVIATEAYGSQLPGVGRRIMPLYSLMIATEPLPDAFWNSVGIPHGTTFSDYRHLLIYGQRTADNRFAFGGRGARYHWGSSIRPAYDQVARVFDHLAATLVDLFPDAFDAEVTHRWGGPLGVSRDWHATVNYNARTGVAFAGGYVGDGLSTTNLAGRTLAALLTGVDASHVAGAGGSSGAGAGAGGASGRGVSSAAVPYDLTRLPWVNHVSPRWEPEPLRFIGANLGLASADLADREEQLTARASRTARLLGPLTGH